MTATNRINGLNGREDKVGVSAWWDQPYVSDNMLKSMQKDETTDLRERHAEYKSRLTSDAARYLAPTPRSLQRLRPHGIFQDEASKWSPADVNAWRLANEINGYRDAPYPPPITRLAEVDIPGSRG
ncbi:hypothetical protein MTO96_047034 [Rhipicephalus appendiculatus]